MWMKSFSIENYVEFQWKFFKSRLFHFMHLIVQIVNLLLTGDWTTFCEEYAKFKETGNRKYDRVTPGLAGRLYEKYVSVYILYTCI